MILKTRPNLNPTQVFTSSGAELALELYVNVLLNKLALAQNSLDDLRSKVRRVASTCIDAPLRQELIEDIEDIHDLCNT